MTEHTLQTPTCYVGMDGLQALSTNDIPRLHLVLKGIWDNYACLLDWMVDECRWREAEGTISPEMAEAYQECHERHIMLLDIGRTLTGCHHEIPGAQPMYRPAAWGQETDLQGLQQGSTRRPELIDEYGNLRTPEEDQS